ncbi:hypothetical protein A2366_04635 [Candidatus Woesebacteria bacterium RIFOXYB1_FULL_33_9]|nr:MAG: hypothetical protein A2366_04635 [Candidatus Woesebacteria bacterium RIFOXYB1_FULL_33_9]
MFDNYIASKKDLLAVEKALEILWNPKLDYIFKYKERIENIPVTSFDSKYIYLWTRKNNKYNLSKFTHNIKKIDDSLQKGWRSGIYIQEIKNILKKETGKVINGPCGGLLTPFTEIHKKISKTSSDPYFTKESYYATILHEFGHIYWDSFKLWWPSDKKENLNFLKTAKGYYMKDNISTKTNIIFPNPRFVSEIFAFCTEYSASKIFWPEHIKYFDKFAIHRIEKMILEEKNKDLGVQDSSLEANINPHDYALVAGKTLLTQSLKNWVSILIKPLRLT